MNNKRLYMDVHAIQVLPPSNINRDDTGSPKTAQYGGVRRARVSSQAWKRAIRCYFKENSLEFGVSIRTRNVVSYVAEKVMQLAPDIDYDKAIKDTEDALKIVGIETKKETKKKTKTEVKKENYVAEALFPMSNKQAEMLAKAIVNGKYTKNDKEILEQILKDNPGIDIVLFGRMVAKNAILNSDAVCQVAHAISTHAVQTEFDYYTAVDDLSSEDQTGAGMVGNIEYNSSTLYRYANISVHEFIKKLDDEASAISASKLFIEAFSNSMPTGKINTFANQTIPSFVMVTLREDRPVSLVSAFEHPVHTKPESGYVNQSVEKLVAEYDNTGKFVDAPIGNFCLNVTDQSINGIGEACDNLKDLLQKVGQKIEDYLKEIGDLN